MQENRETRKISKFKFCCYQIDDDHQDDKKQIRRNHNPMIQQNKESNIKFSPSMRNSNIKIYKLLQDLYENMKDINQILPILIQKRVNPQIAESLTQRDDLEYYVPQLITYMVVQCNLQNQQLNSLLIKACMTDFYFAHSVYFYLQSLSKSEEGVPIPKVANFIQQQFLPKMKIYEQKHLTGHTLTRSMIGRKSSHTHQYYKWQQDLEKLNPNQEQIQLYVNYGTKKYPDPYPDYPKTVKKVRIKPYNFQIMGGFNQTPKFLCDLVLIGEKLVSYPPDQRFQALKKLVKEQINNNLPAAVYIPFFTKMTRMYTVLNVWQGRVFSTKQRAPFSLWLQLYRQQEEQIKQVLQDIQQLQQQKSVKKKKSKINDNLFHKIYESLSKPFTIADGKNTLKLKNFMVQQKQKIQDTFRRKITFQSFNQKYQDESPRTLSNSQIYESKSQGRSFHSQSQEDFKDQKILKQSLQSLIFPIPSQQVISNIKRKSIYRNLKSWRAIHIMVKTGDDLRQQQFAMQLIGKFQYIFQKQRVDCVLKPYQVLSLGPNYGVIQMLNDVTTLDSLFRKIAPMQLSLKGFFQQNWKEDLNTAKTNFMRSLAGYSLITYFLQVKDRHNGNIMLHRDGSIIHIDFGFFLSNAPGKGLQLQKNCPFKLLSEYVQVLGSTNSQMFFQFRRLFYKGFLAILKNRLMILSLVKMMYKSHGDMMNCFIKGERAIQQLQIRLNPEGDIQNFCYQLINNSLDNWRAKWYDKFQYFLQKIYY